MTEDRRQHPVSAEWRSRLLELPRLNKRLILVALDFLLLSLALWISISIRYNTTYIPPDWVTALVLISGPVLTVVTFTLSGLYRFVTRYLGYRGHTRIIGCIWLSVLIWSLVVLMSGQLGIPRSVVLGYGVLATLLIAGSREVAAMMLESAGIRLSELADQRRAHAGHHLRRGAARRATARRAAARLQSHRRRLRRHRALAVAAVRCRHQGAPPRQAAVAHRASSGEGNPRRPARRSAARASPHPQGPCRTSRSR